MDSKSIIFVCKDTCFCEYAKSILESAFDKSEIFTIIPNKKSDLDIIKKFSGIKYIISFLSPYKIDGQILEKAEVAAINFHPGSPNYPGTGCYNFALYEESKIYGVTCHHMDNSLDSGNIIMTSYFDILPLDNVDSLKLKSMIHLLYLFEKVVSNIRNNKKLPVSNEKWMRKAFTRKELNDLCKIDPNIMDKEEIERRIKATCVKGYPEFGPKILFDKYEFFLHLEGDKNE